MDNLQNDYSIIFSHVQKAYGSNVVINDLNLNIRKGERLILLGPSGCGDGLVSVTQDGFYDFYRFVCHTLASG